MRRGKVTWLLMLMVLLFVSSGHAQRDPSRRPSQVIVLVIRPLGFEPDQMSLPAGRIFFSVHNRTGLSDLNLQLDRGSSAVRTVPLQRSKQAWRGIVELTPGNYVVSVRENPRWVCQIRVTQ
jgi:hypothetical protein